MSSQPKAKPQAAPTKEGLRRYPPNGRYRDATNFEWTCTCTSVCAEKCLGQCGCEACITALEDLEEFGGMNG